MARSNGGEGTGRYPANEGEGLALLLVSQQGDALHQVGGQDEVLDADHLVDVELGVDEGHPRQVVVLQAPQENLRGAEVTPPAPQWSLVPPPGPLLTFWPMAETR